MPRPPNPKSKGCTVHYFPKPGGEEEQVRAFKELCARDGIEMRQVIQEAITAFLRKHNYPPGNPQHQIMEFSVCTPKEKNVVMKPKREEIDYSKLSTEELQALNDKFTRWGIQKHLGAYAMVQYELKKREVIK